MNKISKSITLGLQEALEDGQGKRTLLSHTYSIVPVREYKAEEIKEIRCELGMSQAFFANFMGVSKRTVEAWEAGRNMPDGPARRIFAMLQADPNLPERFHIVTR